MVRFFWLLFFQFFRFNQFFDFFAHLYMYLSKNFYRVLDILMFFK
jgi:hypothetical protein